ncbi:hypothetical protein B296_00024841, partial [Ensete ventricosum]
KAEAPLLEAAASAGGRSCGRATVAQTLGNIVVSIVGTGVLGLPYAFRVAGWLAGSLGVAAAGVSTYYCMLLIVSFHYLPSDVLLKASHNTWFVQGYLYAVLDRKGGMAVFCFEGFSMTLALEASMAERRKFPWVLLQAFIGITVAYVFRLRRMISELPFVFVGQAGLCIALAFTFPIMMHPINEIIETRLKSSRWFQKLSHTFLCAEWLGLHGSRILVLVVLSMLASFVPGFGNFVSFVGSTVCALLSFVLPAMFHLTILGSEMRFWQRILDYCIILVGLAFAGYGTLNTISGYSSN